jgi:asparagine synthetase B (glutamine-hydrolysing)
MDFLISQNKPPGSLRNFYGTTWAGGSLWIGSVPSGNRQVFEYEGGLTALAAGSVFGALSEKENLSTTDRKVLGKHALSSNGSFAVAIPHDRAATVVTDAGGSIPVYHGQGPDGWGVGTRVQDVAVVTGLEAIDRISVVDFLMNASVCYPYSWYEDIRVVAPGSVCTFDETGDKCHNYWTPDEPADIDEKCDPQAWGQRLRFRVKNGVHDAIKDKKKGRVLFSAGTDSRAVLSLVPNAFECTPTTVLGHKNREYRLAKRAAALLGRELEYVQRPENYYRSCIEHRIDRIGPGLDFRHTHIYGPVAECFEDVGVLLGGYAADTLFKTHYMSNVARRNTRPDALLEPRPNDIKSPPGDVGGSPLSDTGGAPFQKDLVQAVRERRNEHHHRLKKIRPKTAGNWHRLWPLANLLAYTSYLSCLRMEVATVEPFLWHQSYQLAARMPDAARVDRRAFRAAFSEGMGMAGWWPTDSGRIPRLGGYLGNAVRVPVRGTQRLIDMVRPSGDVQGSWPPFQWGWHDVKVDEHFSKEGQHLYHRRLDDIMMEGQGADSLQDAEYIPARLRALTLAFKVE